MKKPSTSDKHAEAPPAANNKNNDSALPDPKAAELDRFSLGDVEVDEPSPDEDVEMELKWKLWMFLPRSSSNLHFCDVTNDWNSLHTNAPMRLQI